MFAVLVLAVHISGKVPAVAALAPCVLCSRIGQSLAHLLGTARPLVFVRTTFWFSQLALFSLMRWRLLRETVLSYQYQT